MVGIAVTLGVFLAAMVMSLQSAYLNSRTVMGPRAWDSFLMFFPFVAMWAILSESITRNPFDERFTGVLLGVLLVFPQFFYNRAFFLKHREQVGQSAPQIILDEESESMIWDMPGDTGHHGAPRGRASHYPGNNSSISS